MPKNLKSDFFMQRDIRRQFIKQWLSDFLCKNVQWSIIPKEIVAILYAKSAQINKSHNNFIKTTYKKEPIKKTHKKNHKKNHIKKIT